MIWESNSSLLVKIELIPTLLLEREGLVEIITFTYVILIDLVPVESGCMGDVDIPVFPKVRISEIHTQGK